MRFYGNKIYKFIELIVRWLGWMAIW